MLLIFLRGNSTVIHRLVVATCCCVRYVFKSGEEKIKEVIFSQEDWLPTCLQAPGYKTGMHLQNACIILLQNIYIQLTYPQKSLYKTVININCIDSLFYPSTQFCYSAVLYQIVNAKFLSLQWILFLGFIQETTIIHLYFSNILDIKIIGLI